MTMIYVDEFFIQIEKAGILETMREYKAKQEATA